MRRALLAVAVLVTVIEWANCSFSTTIPSPGMPRWNTFFAGCFEGLASGGLAPKTTIVLVPGASDALTLGGCVKLAGETRTVSATLAGQVEDTGDRLRATLTAMPTAGGAPFNILVERRPTTQEPALNLDVRDAGAAPFARADGLTRCASTCADLMIPLPFLPAGDAP